MASPAPWKNKNGSKYKLNSLQQKPLFLIVCEGHTERLYFQSFRVPTLNVEIITKGASSIALVESTIRRPERRKYQEVWCVFDFDVNPLLVDQKQDFNQAIAKATQNKIKCAYSNDSFELWFILHYNYTDQENSRREYNEQLSRKWDMNYNDDGKRRDFSSAIYQKLIDDPNACQVKAIERAKKLYHQQKDKQYHLQNPISTVFQLVELLNNHLSR